MAERIAELFNSFQDYLNSEEELREEIRIIVRDLEKSSRDILMILQNIHNDDNVEENISIYLPNPESSNLFPSEASDSGTGTTHELQVGTPWPNVFFHRSKQLLFTYYFSTVVSRYCASARELFEDVRKDYTRLAQVVPKDQYYRFHDHWRSVTQKLCFLASLVIYLEIKALVTKEVVAEMLGIKNSKEDGFHLDLENFLMGLLQLATELSRFAVNSVTNGDYNRPIEIAKFVNELNAGFRLLNLKNDTLRKRFDSLKYSVRKVEEVVYDLSIRGLKPGQNPVNQETE